MFITLCLDDATFEITRRFYERLGLRFEPERHGEKGLPHYATVQSDVALEIYPTLKALPAEDRLFVGLPVDASEQLQADLIASCGGAETDPPTATTKSGIATLRDPNGILIRLIPKATT